MLKNKIVDVGSLHMPLKQMGYTTIGDFIRDIPAEVYEPYKAQCMCVLCIGIVFKIYNEH